MTEAKRMYKISNSAKRSVRKLNATEQGVYSIYGEYIKISKIAQRINNEIEISARCGKNSLKHNEYNIEKSYCDCIIKLYVLMDLKYL